MSRTIFALGLSFFVLAAPAFAADPTSHETHDTMTIVSAELARTPSRRPAGLPALYVGSGLLQAFDAYSTMKALNLGAVEANPVMRGATSNPIAFIGIKASVAATSILLAERLWKDHHRVAAVAAMVASNGLMAWVAAHNASVISSLQR